MESHNRIALYLQVQNTLDVRRFAILYREELASVCSLTVNDGCVRKWNTGRLKTELRVSIRISFRFCRFHWGVLRDIKFSENDDQEEIPVAFADILSERLPHWPHPKKRWIFVNFSAARKGCGTDP